MMPSGVAMMLKSLLGIEPAEIERQVTESAKMAFDLLQSINNRLGSIETQNATMQKTLDRIERNGIPMFPSESALEKFYGENPGIQSAEDFLRLTAIKGVSDNGEESSGESGKPN
jgi:hypothetical protein